jgi:hypothetical protein
MNGYQKLFDLKHYRVTVVSLKRHAIPFVSDDQVYLGDAGDVFSVYAKPDHLDSGYFTTWFSSHVDGYESDNKLSFGRIKKVEQFRGQPNSLYYVTKLGRFIVEEIPWTQNEK